MKFSSRASVLLLYLWTGLFLSTAVRVRGEDTFIFTVQLTASVTESPATITLTWITDPYGANSYEVYRKQKTDTSWGNPIATLPGSALSYKDSTVTIGSSYEYQLIKYATLGYKGYGYIYVGVLSPLSENRGKVVLVVATDSTSNIEPEVQRLQEDLEGDSWKVVRRNVLSSQSPSDVRSLIRSDYLADPANVNCAFLLGHVPILQSGNMNYDGHLVRPMPADAYYGEMDELWPTDSSISPSYIPSDIELMVGRVDFYNMPVGVVSEAELLRRYLDRDHAWRVGAKTYPRRALMGNRRGDEGGEATSASGYRNFEPMVGHGNIIEAPTSDTTLNNDRWVSMLGRNEYLLAYGCGGGLPQGISWLGTNGPYKEAWSSDVVRMDAKVPFVFLFGSWFGNWDGQDNFLRSFLVNNYGLASGMAGRPHWFMHHWALGEPLGYSVCLSINNSTLYRNQTNAEMRAVYVALMGDPTLRLDVVRPSPWLSATRTSNGVSLEWGASPDAAAGYYVYRAAAGSSDYSRITPSPVTSLSFTDPTAPWQGVSYMLKAIRLEQQFSGSYFNSSQGIKTSVSEAMPTPPTIRPTLISGNIVLTWDSLPGRSYRVQSRPSFSDIWTDVVSLWASDYSLSWTNSVFGGSASYYRIATP